MNAPPGGNDTFVQGGASQPADAKPAPDPREPLLETARNPSLQQHPGAAPSAAEDVTETAYGPYRLGRKLGEGGFGAVYEAEQEYPVRRRVALKLIKLGMDTQEVLARFEAERQALALMEHPNIARVLDAGSSAAGRPYFVMELVQGEPISAYCDRHRLSIVERLQLFDQVCQAVQHAHTKGIIHRDLKPSNVLVANEGDQPLAKVIDFGIAKATSGNLTDRGALTEQLQMVGTPLYMSPEQAQGSADIDTRTDIYSLGVLLYQLLTDSTPFESGTLRMAQYAEILRVISEVDPPQPSARLALSESTLAEIADKRRTEPRKLIRAVRGELDWIVMKAIEKDRARRYDMASALAMDVRRHLSGQPLLAAPPSRAYRIRKFARRHRLAVGAGAMVAASLIVGMLGFAWQAHIARQRADELEQVSGFQAEMLGQVDPTQAGRLLGRNLNSKFIEALAKAGVPEAERDAQAAAFAAQLHRVNATDAARDLIDSTILRPAAEAIERQFKDQPLVDASLRQVLADRYRGMGLYDAALPLQLRALETRRRVLGGDHPATLVSVEAMGSLLLSQGKLGEAEAYFREALDQRRRVLGAEHPDTLRSISKLGFQLESQGKLNEAEPYYREALEKRRRVLGAEHPDTLNSIGSLGDLLQMQGRLGEAEPYVREAAANYRRVLGEEHPDTLTAIYDLGYLLKSQGKLGEAEPYYREAMDKHRRVQGEEHPDTLNAIAQMGSLLVLGGRLDEAEPYVREAAEKLRRVLGEEHPDTLSAVNNLGFLLRSQGRLDEAEIHLREAMNTCRRVLGDEHPTTLNAINNLAGILQAQGRLGEAEPYIRESLETSRRTRGDEYPITLIYAINLAALRANLGAHAETVAMFDSMQAAVRRVFTGDEAFRLGKLLTAAGKARAGLGQYPVAEGNLLEAHGILALTPGPNPTLARDCIQAIVELYGAWDASEPGKGYAAKAAEWERKSTADAATGPAPAK